MSSKLSMTRVDEKLWQNSCRRQKVIDSFSLFKKENASTRFGDRQLFPIDHTKYVSVRCVSKQSSITKSHRWEKVVDEKKLSTAPGLVYLQPERKIANSNYCKKKPRIFSCFSMIIHPCWGFLQSYVFFLILTSHRIEVIQVLIHIAK